MCCRRATIALLILFTGSPLAAQEAKPQFRRLDRDKNGQLTRGEIPERLLERIDADGDGAVTATEDRRFLRRRDEPQGQPEGRQVRLRLAPAIRVRTANVPTSSGWLIFSSISSTTVPAASHVLTGVVDPGSQFSYLLSFCSGAPLARIRWTPEPP